MKASAIRLQVDQPASSPAPSPALGLSESWRSASASANSSAELPTSPRAGFPVESSDTVRVVCAIPARFASQRLPGKPLRTLAGKPMIQHVVERVQRAEGIVRTVVLTDDDRIAQVVRDFGGEVEMTPAECASGTDRIAWAARSWPTQLDNEGKPAQLAVINVQGDEPLIDPALVARVAAHLANHPEDEMVTVSTSFETPSDPSAPDNRLLASDPSNVKVVTDLEGNALYFSRSLIPSGHATSAGAKLHVGLYGYRLDVLQRLASLEPTPLERAESLEQLRALENGIRIRVLETRHRAFGVDTEDDLRRAEALLTG